MMTSGSRAWIVGIVAVNWLVWGIVTGVQGGEALMGEITQGGEYSFADTRIPLEFLFQRLTGSCHSRTRL
jgi:hypothetical protein